MSRILVAEDEKNIRELLTKALPIFLGKEHVYEIVEDGAKLVEKSQENKYNLILTDVDMPFKNGIEAIIDIKKGEINKETPILVMTGKFVEHENAALRAGAKEVLAKPFENKELADMIRKYL